MKIATLWQMKAFGYERETSSDRLIDLTELTLVADADTLRKLANLLHHSAERMDQHGTDLGHEHFSDFIGCAWNSPVFVDI